jgi:hypothetical protein
LIPLETILFDHHIGIGLGGDGEGEEEEEEFDPSEVANLFTHASLLSSSRTRNQDPFASRIPSEVPFFTLRITL